MSRIIGLIVLVVVAFVAYSYFFGEGEEKETATEIVNDIKGLGEGVKDLFEDHKEKYERGDYDEVLDKIGSFVDKLKSKTADLNKDEEKEVNKIEDEIRKIQKELDSVDPEDSKTIRKIEEEIRSLVREANRLVDEVENK